MQTVRTIVCKLNPTHEQQAEIDATLVAFAAACNYIATVCLAISSTNRVEVQRECYWDVRADFGLSANLAIRAIARVCISLKVKGRGKSSFNPTSIDYDARIFDYRQKDMVFSLTLLHSRQRVATVLGQFQLKTLAGRKPTSATLCRRSYGGYYLHVQVKDAAPEMINVTATLGIDLGQRRVAVDSDGAIHEANEVNWLREHYPKVRRSIQRKGTRGARRLLKRLSRRERRHMTHINHVLSRRLVDKALQSGRSIALEDLTGIRKRTKYRKAQRYRKESWAFFQLRTFIFYKALAVGVPVVFVDPAYTSQDCHRCGLRGRRYALRFRCVVCGDCDADVNGAKNIAARGAHVIAPKHSGTVMEPCYQGESPRI